jgi:hypothetical protein
MPKLKVVDNEPPAPDLSRFDMLVKAFVATGRVIEEIEAEHRERLKKPLRLKELLTEELLNRLAETGQEMARTKYGTVSAAVRDTASCSDPNLFIDYVREHDAYELLDRRPNVTACREYNNEHGMLPPGVKLNSIRYISMRSTTAQKEAAQTEDNT